MPQIEWKESFSVHHDKIDALHKQWVDIHNQIDRAISETCLQTQTRIIEQSLQTIMDYTSSHFRLEEEFMRQIGYPDIAAHVRMHKDFDTLIYIYYRSVSAGEPILNSRLLKIVRKWVLEHVLLEDRKYCLPANIAAQKRPPQDATQTGA